MHTTLSILSTPLAPSSTLHSENTSHLSRCVSRPMTTQSSTSSSIATVRRKTIEESMMERAEWERKLGTMRQLKCNEKQRDSDLHQKESRLISGSGKTDVIQDHKKIAQPLSSESTSSTITVTPLVDTVQHSSSIVPASHLAVSQPLISLPSTPRRRKTIEESFGQVIPRSNQSHRSCPAKESVSPILEEGDYVSNLHSLNTDTINGSVAMKNRHISLSSLLSHESELTKEQSLSILLSIPSSPLVDPNQTHSLSTDQKDASSSPLSVKRQDEEMEGMIVEKETTLTEYEGPRANLSFESNDEHASDCLLLSNITSSEKKGDQRIPFEMENEGQPIYDTRILPTLNQGDVDYCMSPIGTSVTDSPVDSLHSHSQSLVRQRDDSPDRTIQSRLQSADQAVVPSHHDVLPEDQISSSVHGLTSTTHNENEMSSFPLCAKEQGETMKEEIVDDVCVYREEEKNENEELTDEDRTRPPDQCVLECSLRPHAIDNESIERSADMGDCMCIREPSQDEILDHSLSTAVPASTVSIEGSTSIPKWSSNALKMERHEEVNMMRATVQQDLPSQEAFSPPQLNENVIAKNQCTINMIFEVDKHENSGGYKSQLIRRNDPSLISSFDQIASCSTHIQSTTSHKRIRPDKLTHSPDRDNSENLRPLSRPSRLRPFRFTTVELVGPVYCRDRLIGMEAYVLLFTCTETHSIHWEMMMSTEVNEFIAALRRFMKQRGCSEELWSISQQPSQLRNNSSSDPLTIAHLKLHSWLDLRWRMNWKHDSLEQSHCQELQRTFTDQVKAMITSLLNPFMPREKMTSVFLKIEKIVNRRSNETILIRPLHVINSVEKSNPDEDVSEMKVLQRVQWNRTDHRPREEAIKKTDSKHDKDTRAEKVINALDSKLHYNEMKEGIYRVMGLPEPCRIRLQPWKPQMISSRRGLLELTKEFPDPAGLFSPLTVTLKRLAKRLNIGKEKSNWLTNDEKEEVNDFIGRFRTYFFHVPMMPFPLFPERGKKDGELVVFCHGDKDSYAAAVYWMSAVDNATTLILAKVRLLPSPDPLTRRAYARPEADLRAVELGLTLLHEAQKILSSYERKMMIGAATCLTDCRITYHRLSERHSEKINLMNRFAKQRMTNIVETEGSILKHHSDVTVNGKKNASADGYLKFALAPKDANPAELATRGLNIFYLEHPPGKTAGLWWRGTEDREGMRKAMESFPPPEPLDLENRDDRYAFCGAVDPMYRRIKADCIDALRSWIPAVEKNDSLYISTDEIRRIGSYSSMIDTLALKMREECMRAQRSVLLPNDMSFIKREGALSDEERNCAEILLIKQHQSRWRDQWERIGGFRPNKDRNNIIRKGESRSGTEDASLDIKLPFFLFPNDPFTHKLIHHFHRDEEKCDGAARTLELLRDRFWLIGGLKTVKKALRKCDACKTPICVPTLPYISTMAMVSCLLTVVPPSENASIQKNTVPVGLESALHHYQSSPPTPTSPLLPRMQISIETMQLPRFLSS